MSSVVNSPIYVVVISRVAQCAAAYVEDFVRKNYEEAEANAIGTEYARADLLPAMGAKAVRELLKRYLDQRILFYPTRDGQQINHINCETTTLQADLWSTMSQAASTQPTPLMALAVAGMKRCTQCAGVHPSSVVEPSTYRSMGKGTDRNLL